MQSSQTKNRKEKPLRLIGTVKSLKTINDRIEFVRVAFDYPIQAFAKKIGVSKASITNVVASEVSNKPSYEMLLSILKVFPVTEEWLMVGKGQPFTEDDVTEHKYVEASSEPSLDIEVNQRLRSFRLESEETQAMFADKLKVTRDVIAFIENNRQSITIPILKRAIQNCNINPMWLLFGIGNNTLVKRMT